MHEVTSYARSLLAIAALVLDRRSLGAGTASLRRAHCHSGTPEPAPVDQGNSSSQSVGVVQVGPVTVDPASAVADTPVGDVVSGRRRRPSATPAATERSQSRRRRPGRRRQHGHRLGRASSRSAHSIEARSHGDGERRPRDDLCVHGRVGRRKRHEHRKRLGGCRPARKREHGERNRPAPSQIQPSTATVAAHVHAAGGAAQGPRRSRSAANEVLGDLLGVDLPRSGRIPARPPSFVLDVVQLR